ncbi:hypothetical protein [Streptomyces sp. NBC_00459]|uniref:hypothetical protein n=1 Tax=Streptomyces sp. NBC_00459 TaxID=2975749 RepID=UPI002E19CF11
MSSPLTPGLRTARKAAIPALLLSLTLGGLGMAGTAHAASGASCSSLPSTSCSPQVKITGDENNVQAVPRGLQEAVNALDDFDWPTGERYESWEYDVQLTQTHQLVRRYVSTGGRYWDNGADLTRWLHGGGAGSDYTHFQSGFQEYYGHLYDFRPSADSAKKLGNFRIVRALGRGVQPTWVSIDHYKSFRFIGFR